MKICGTTAASSSSVTVSFFCDDPNGDLHSGSSSGQVGIGPYGIGASMTTSAHDGGNLPVPEYPVQSTVSFQWSQDFVIEGAEGSGFVIPTLTGGCGGFAPGDAINLNLFGQACLPPSGFFVNPMPVTFGADYTLTMSGSMHCSFGYEGCGSGELYVSDLVFTDAAGNPLPNAILVPVPETYSLILLATVAATCMARRRAMKAGCRKALTA